MFSGPSRGFLTEFSTGISLLQLDHPGAVQDLVAHVQSFVVGGPGRDPGSSALLHTAGSGLVEAGRSPHRKYEGAGHRLPAKMFAGLSRSTASVSRNDQGKASDLRPPGQEDARDQPAAQSNG